MPIHDHTFNFDAAAFEYNDNHLPADDGTHHHHGDDHHYINPYDYDATRVLDFGPADHTHPDTPEDGSGYEGRGPSRELVDWMRSTRITRGSVAGGEDTP